MKYLLLLGCCLSWFYSVAQKPTVKWGEEIKMSREITDLRFILADKSGLYLEEGHLTNKFGALIRKSAKLLKLNKNFVEVFKSDFDDDLKGRKFIQFFTFKDRMYMIASRILKRDGMVVVDGIEVNKQNGSLVGDWKEMTSFQRTKNTEDMDFKISYNADSSTMLFISRLKDKADNVFSLQEFGENLHSKGNAVEISNGLGPETFQLEDVIYTNKKRIIVVGREFVYRNGKKKEKFLDFSQYNIRIYNETGKQIADINTSTGGKTITSAKVLQENNNDIVLAGFFSKSPKDKTIDGLLIQRIDPVSGNVMAASETPITQDMLGGEVEDTDTEESGALSKKQKEKLKDSEDESFSAHMKFRKIYYTSDSALILLAEKFHHKKFLTSRFRDPSPARPAMTVVQTTYSAYECGNIMISRINKAGKVEWIKVLPKAQREWVVDEGPGSSDRAFPGLWDPVSRPFMAGFGSIQARNKITIFFNDMGQNASVLQPGQKVKRIEWFPTSACFAVSVDEVTGKMERHRLFENAAEPTFLPRFTMAYGNELFMIRKQDLLIGKARLTIGKSTIR